MLKTVALANPAQKYEFLQTFDPTTSSWIVSDLRNKFEVQQFILTKQNFFEDLSAFRASELWRYLLKKTRPELKLMSKDFLRAWLSEQMQKEHPDLSQQTEDVVLDLMDLMASVNLHSEGATRMREWFRDNPESLQRWGTWFLLAEKYTQKLLQLNRAAPTWSASILQNEAQWEEFWSRPLVFDLGSQLTTVEAELIFSLSKVCDVTVLMPEPQWKDNFKYLLSPYEYLFSKATERGKAEANPSLKSTELVSHRYSGILAEAKASVEFARMLLEQKVEVSRIAIVAPDVEKYWPLLQPLLKAEGIPVAKDLTVRLQTLPAVSLWISDLKLSAGQVEYSDLENAYFHDPQSRLGFEEFYALFSELLSGQDLKRHQDIQKAFQAQYNSDNVLKTEEWIGFAASRWRSKSDFAPMEILLREFLEQMESSSHFKLSSWIQLLESLAAKKEMRLEKGVASGIQVTNLVSADSLTISHRFFMGLSESQIKEGQRALLQPTEVSSIATQLGFYLEHPEVSLQEFDLAWISENRTEKTVLSFPQTGFSGGAESPASLWLANAAEGVKLAPLQGTRWDHWIDRPLDNVRLLEDMGKAEKPDIKLSKKISLSPSSIETYRQCAFIFASQKIYRLMDLPILDLDVDRRTRGQLAHALLEKISEEPRRFDWSTGELQTLIASLREPLGLSHIDDFVWQGLSERHLSLASRFLQFEMEWKTRFPKTAVHAREQGFEFGWDGEHGKVKAFTEGDWKIRGKIDRIDRDPSGNMVVLDYKMSAGSFGHASNWITDNQLQLALYMLAVEGGVIAELPPGPVIGAFYYVLKNLNREKGLKVEELAGSLFDLDKKKNRMSLAQKEELLSGITKIIQQTVQGISQGHFPAEPLDENDCKTCAWRNLCRAPHLN